MSPRPQREVHLDEFTQVDGHYTATMWTHNLQGERVEVELKVLKSEFPSDMMDPEWSKKSSIIRERLALAHKELIARAL